MDNPFSALSAHSHSLLKPHPAGWTTILTEGALNALVQACNQKTSRNPVMQLTQGEVGHTVNLLRDRELIRSSFSGRAERYEQKLGRHLELGREEQAVLCVLLLRGPRRLSR
ncbi:MAG: hypothetical protein DIZ77_09170 [endosymbiont of Seepiophila jonesi]|uniref:Uncharacterized protein n=1 Tax=endosymbiont of Lamellibrachia luymesi TaxID=2200907 RepID=A0A370DYM8_9GAMM|nr:MAG: hypothetical protein DIZ79_09930 [endosymbiont of Lamellibrachia luymesi]RDH92159.1 MAG: hypothetical protein DIZ77_09170 [endosymbiont of Seepiophila jonesi]